MTSRTLSDTDFRIAKSMLSENKIKREWFDSVDEYEQFYKIPSRHLLIASLSNYGWMRLKSNIRQHKYMRKKRLIKNVQEEEGGYFSPEIKNKIVQLIDCLKIEFRNIKTQHSLLTFLISKEHSYRFGSKKRSRNRK